MSDELKHYGILGMKWGIRRYQPYPKGQEHKGRYVKSKAKINRDVDKVRKGAAVAKGLSSVVKKTTSTYARSMASKAEENQKTKTKRGAALAKKGDELVSRAADKYVDAMDKKVDKAQKIADKKIAALDAKAERKIPVERKLSDAELKRAVKRLQLERQYSSLSKRQITEGEKIARNVIVGATTGFLVGKATKGYSIGWDKAIEILKETLGK